MTDYLIKPLGVVEAYPHDTDGQKVSASFP